PDVQARYRNPRRRCAQAGLRGAAKDQADDVSVQNRSRRVAAEARVHHRRHQVLVSDQRRRRLRQPLRVREHGGGCHPDPKPGDRGASRGGRPPETRAGEMNRPTTLVILFVSLSVVASCNGGSGGTDGAGGNQTYSCGSDTCTVGESFCYAYTPGTAGQTGRSCQLTPAACASTPASCACLCPPSSNAAFGCVPVGMGAGNYCLCSETGGGVTVTCAGS